MFRKVTENFLEEREIIKNKLKLYCIVDFTKLHNYKIVNCFLQLRFYNH